MQHTQPQWTPPPEPGMGYAELQDLLDETDHLATTVDVWAGGLDRIASNEWQELFRHVTRLSLCIGRLSAELPCLQRHPVLAARVRITIEEAEAAMARVSSS